MAVDGGISEGAQYGLLLKLDMAMDDFVSDWAHCDRFSTYVARMISHNRTDSLLYSNLFSSAFNELLETAFRMHVRGGNFTFGIWRQGMTDRIELTLPCDPALSSFYHAAAGELASPDIADRFRTALFADGPLKPNIGLLELAVDYHARISIAPRGEDTLTLAAEFTLEEP
jgi:hypothetical protein